MKYKENNAFQMIASIILGMELVLELFLFWDFCICVSFFYILHFIFDWHEGKWTKSDTLTKGQ